MFSNYLTTVLTSTVGNRVAVNNQCGPSSKMITVSKVGDGSLGDCTTINSKLSGSLRAKSLIRKCSRAYKNVFKKGIHGQVDVVDSRFLRKCNRGDTTAFYEEGICCPGQSQCRVYHSSCVDLFHLSVELRTNRPDVFYADVGSV